MSMTNLLQLLVSGITVGAIYGLIALGYVTIYRSSRVVNFAQGAFVMLGALVTYTLLEQVGLPYPVAALGAILIITLVGLAAYRLIVAPLLGVSIAAMIMATIGISMLAENVALLRWGGYGNYLPPFSGATPIILGGVAVQPQSLWVLLVTAAVLAALYFLANHTLMGKQMTATATNPVAASLVGISTRSMIAWSFAISAAIGTIAGICIAPIVPISFASGGLFGLKGFIAAILGGWGKSTGAVVGGLVLGVAETLSAGLLPSGYKDAIAFLVLLLILYFRPVGILGSSLTEAE